MRVTICVPTFERPEYLVVALHSIFAQDYSDLEILIGDDSPDDASERAVAALEPPPGTTLRYARNVPGVGQNANVDALLKAAGGAYLAILHDDDIFLPGAIASMVAAAESHPGVELVFGKQQIVDATGALLERETSDHNLAESRIASRAGTQPSSLACALRRQIPNDGFLVETALAQRTGYRSMDEVGVYCDVDFNLRAAENLAPHSILFIDRFVSAYRWTTDAISHGARASTVDHPHAGLMLYERVLDIEPTPELRDARKVMLTQKSDKAFKALALRGDRIGALRIFFSPYYPLSRRLSSKGAYHLALLVTPAVERFRRY